MTPETLDSNELLIFVQDGEVLKPIAATRDATFTASAAKRDRTTKDSAGWEESRSGLKSATISFDGLQTYANPEGSLDFDVLWGYFKNGTIITFAHGGNSPAEKAFMSTGWVSNLEVGTPQNEEATLSGEIVVTGEFDFEVVGS